MAITYRLKVSVVLDDPDGTKSTVWKAGIKTKAIQLRDGGVFPAWIPGTGKIGISCYNVGGEDTTQVGVSWPDAPTAPEPEVPPEI